MNPSLPALFVALAVLAAPAAAQDIAKGVAAYERGDYEAALGHWRPLAGRGDADAQASLGLLYARGHGVGQDYGEAIKWFQLSVTQGYAIAQNNLGVMYRNGYGVQQNYAKAVMFYRLSAAQGYALAQSSLGAMYENGDGARRDYEQAYMWYSLAAAQGHAGATKARQLLEPLMSGQQQRRALARIEERQARNSAPTASKLIRPVGAAGPGNVANGPPPETASPPAQPLSSPEEAAAKISIPLPQTMNGKGWRVQLIALRRQEQTAAVWSQLQQANQDLLDGLELHVQLAELSEGTFYRVQAGPLADRTGRRQRPCATP